MRPLHVTNDSANNFTATYRHDQHTEEALYAATTSARCQRRCLVSAHLRCDILPAVARQLPALIAVLPFNEVLQYDVQQFWRLAAGSESSAG